jgi:hypothetical protein
MTKRKREAPARLFLLAVGLAVLSLLGSEAVAQEQRVTVVVEYVAGATLYIDAGAEGGISAEDTLYVYDQSDGALLGALRVMSSSRGRSVVTFASDPFPITRGEVLEISFIPVALPAEPEIPETEGRSRIASKRSARVDGRLSLSLNALQSTTAGRVVGLEPIHRTFTTPTMRLRLAATHLPGDVTFRTNLRTGARLSSDDLIQPPETFRIYQLSLEKSLRGFPLFVRLGRFHNPFERYSGYWDGLLVRVGGDEGLGVGVAAGFHPDRLNEDFNTELPKASAFLNYRYRSRLIGYRVDASVHHIQPRDGLTQSTYVGLSQRLRWDGWLLTQDLQVDRHPTTGIWRIAQLLVRTAVPVHRVLELYGRYSLRRPSLSPLDSLVSRRREQAGLGLMLRLWNGSIGGDVTATRLESAETGYTYSSFLSFPRTMLLDLGFSGSTSYWTLSSAKTLYLSGGVTRFIGRAQGRASYHRYTTKSVGTELLTQGGELGFAIPLRRRLFATLRAVVSRSENLSSNSLDAQLWMTF